MKLVSTLLAAAAAALVCASVGVVVVDAQVAICPEKLCTLLQVSNTALAKAFDARDVDGVVSGFQPHGGTLYPGQGAGYQSRPVLAKWFTASAFQNWKSIELTTTSAGIIADPNCVWEGGRYNFTSLPNGKIETGVYFALWGANGGGSGRSVMGFVGIDKFQSVHVPDGHIVGAATGATFASAVELVSTITVAYYQRNTTAIAGVYFSDAVVIAGNSNQMFTGVKDIGMYYAAYVHDGVAAVSLVVDNVQAGAGPYFIISGHYRAVGGSKPVVDGPTVGLGRFYIVAARDADSKTFKVGVQMMLPSYKAK